MKTKQTSNFPWDPSLCCLKSTCQMSLGVRSRLCTMGGSAPGVRLCPSQCTIPEGTVCRSIGDLNSESFQPGVLEFTLLLPALFWLLLLSPYLSWSLSSPAFSLCAPAMILHHSSVPVTVVCSPLCLPLSCWPSWVSLSPCSCLLPWIRSSANFPSSPKCWNVCRCHLGRSSTHSRWCLLWAMRPS